MSLTAGKAILLSSAAGGGYEVSRSLRFNSSDSAYLSRTPASAGNRKTWTWAGWVKRSKFGTFQNIFAGYGAGNDSDYLAVFFRDTDELNIAGWGTNYLITTQVFRDASAWYHLVIALDTTQSVSSSRLKIYVNGQEITTYSTDNRASLTQNADRGVNGAWEHNLGRRPFSAFYYCDFYLADVFFVDGQQLTPSSFTEVSATTGQLIPKQYTGSFGTNGFWLKFSDNSAATATTLGKDYSGNSNNWTPNNLSVTAGAGNDSLTDTPTSYGTDTGAGGEVRGNYCTFNPIAEVESSSDRVTVSNGNLDWVGKTSGSGYSYGTIGFVSGKFYYEYLLTSQKGGLQLGFSQQNASSNFGIVYASNAAGTNGEFYLLPSFTLIQSVGGLQGSILGFAIDATNKSFKFYKDGSLQFTYDFSASWNGTSFLFPLAAVGAGGSYPDSTISANFGQRPFAYPVSGFSALCDTNLTAPVVAKPSTVMDVVLYTGNSTDNRAITGLGFSPDLVWFGPRSQSGQDKVICDSVRGVQKALFSNQTYVEADPALYGSVGSFDSNGFTIKKGIDATFGFNQVNLNSSTYVAWTWDAGTTTSSNGSGSITSQVRANASAGFSVVTYTVGSNTSQTIGHGLGVAPQMIIVKERNQANNWQVYHASLGNGSFLYLNGTNASASNNLWNNTSPTSTVFSIRSGGSANFYDGKDHVAYCFAPVAGYSSFGSYTGNGSADGPFVYTGFRPRFLITKRTDSSISGDWNIVDTARGSYNVVGPYVYANQSAAEGTASIYDLLSNGFKIRESGAGTNANGGTYIYMAFAENPFQYARAR